MVRKSILGKIAIPFTILSTASLMLTFNSTKAATISDVVFQKQGILTNGLNTDSGFSLLELPKVAISNLEIISSLIIKGLDWINNLDGSIPKLTADLLTSIYNFLAKIILQTPLFIFNNPYLKNTSLTFSLISISIVTILTVFEAFMQMFRKEHTSFTKILKRWAVVAGVSGFLPFAFESGFTYLNKLTEAITSIGVVNGGNAEGYIYGETVGFFDTLIVILFDLAAIALLIPVCLQSGKRWFDLMCLSAISPLALSSWIFDRHRHYFNKWWNKVKSLSLVQLVYAVFILIMGIFIFSTQAIQGGFFVLLLKLLIVTGGLLRMSNPPAFVSNMTGTKEDIFDEYDKAKGTFIDIKDTLTFKNFRPSTFIKGKLMESQERKLRQKYGVRHLDISKIEKELRNKHGRRNVKDLL